ncbi:PREDICTED: 5-hydroxytryptamine receptor 3C-like [Propithecus coquereli]|uniref:5-hydroxytryptamine receptor 3C-like n=1 Tax=Propithecus coquereli TaxID=379532 RepID=UPI00063F165A|nr:PREDICTED: 5-hydroxytryptamine receptor 3C-like [Propithecus coquereli]
MGLGAPGESPEKSPERRMEGGRSARWGVLLCLTVSLLLPGRADTTFTINCSGFHRHGVDPAAFQAIFNQQAVRPVTNYSIPTHVNISFTLSAIVEVDSRLHLLTLFLWFNMIWGNPFISWDPEECGNVSKLTVTTENLWLPDIFIVESMNVEQIPEGLSAYVTSDGHIVYSKPMRVTSICNLNIFYFPFDQQNCTLTFSSFFYTVDSMLLGMDKEVWEITDTSQNILNTQGEWELLGISKATLRMAVGPSLFDQIMFHVAIRRKPKLYVINLLVPSGFLMAIDALSFYLPAKSGNRAPFKITLLLGYNVFLLMMNKLLPAGGTPLISVYFALCLSLMVLSLLETVFIVYLMHLATNQPPPMPRWLHSLLLHCTCPRKCCPTAPHKGKEGLGLPPAQLPGLKEPVELVGKVPGPGEAEPAGGSGWTRAQQEQEAQKRHRVELWVQFSHMMDTLLFRLYLLFMASCILTVIGLWNT